MFISHKFKAIFVHIQRTAGNSIQELFAQHDPDLVHAIPIDPTKRRTMHAWISDIALAVDREQFGSYTKFCVVRNPFERMVSWYAFFHDARRAADNDGHALPELLEQPPPENGSDNEAFATRAQAIGGRVIRAVTDLAPTFNDFVRLPRDYHEGIFERFYTNQIDYILDNGRIATDVELRFENLANDFQALGEKLGLQATLPHVNASTRAGDWRSSYNAETREIIAKRFERDCARWGYSF